MLAIHDKDELELIDGLGDLLYVMAGAWVAIKGDDTYPTCDDKFRLAEVPNWPVWSANYVGHIRNHVRGCVETAAAFTDPDPRYKHGIKLAIGALHYAGYDIVGIFDEIHASNMTKTPTKGDIRVRVKGPDFRLPDLTRFLRGK